MKYVKSEYPEYLFCLIILHLSLKRIIPSQFKIQILYLEFTNIMIQSNFIYQGLYRFFELDPEFLLVFE